MEKLASDLSHTGGAGERLASVPEHIVDEGEQLLDGVQRGTEAHFGAAREKFESQLRHARSELAALGDTAGHKARRAPRMTGRALNQHPYAAIGIAVGIAALLAAVLANRR